MDVETVPPPPLLKRLSIIGTVLRMARNPEKTYLIERLQEKMRAAGFFRPAVRMIREDLQGRQMLDSRYLNSGVDMPALRRMAEGTLGFEYSKFLDTNGLEPVFYSNREVVDDATYVIMRIRQIHDILHVMTGFDTSIEGEVSLQAFCLKQFCSPTASVLLGGAFLRCLVDTNLSPVSILQAMAAGLETAREYKLLFGQRWEDDWSAPVEDLRQRLRVRVPGRSLNPQQAPG